MCWQLKNVRIANIDAELRDKFEFYGESLLIQAIAGGIINSATQGAELLQLIQLKREKALDWLQEKRDQSERKEQRVERLEWAVLIFVIMGTLTEAVDLAVTLLKWQHT